ncbi:hypothetical protein DWU98_06355 [Dyella monticola]|uniref:Uncharacterized protein n=1 Tax=Dyella monticola TaxID=1927958 RepID=A0A370X3B2_9GAMM|nr:hypothetical protein [Dyella monticola]RDS82770.1 hypothetical protein DWU98_06355 [Dyella monticola]
MRFAQFLLAPWWASPRSACRYALALMVAAIGFGAWITSIGTGQEHWASFVFCYGVTLTVVWAFVVARMLLLARDGNRLLMPAVERSVISSFIFYGLMCLLPALVLATIVQAPLVITAIWLVLFMLGGLALALLPGHVMALIGFMPLAWAAVARFMNTHDMSYANVSGLSALASIALLLLCVARWRLVLRNESASTWSGRDALVLQYQRRDGGLHSWSGEDTTSKLKRAPSWLVGDTSLRGIGPQSISRSLRVALGGVYLPRTLSGHLRRWGPTVFLMALVMLTSQLDLSALLSPPNIALTICYLAIISTMVATFTAVKVLGQRWRKPNAELALLALLPGLGTPEIARWHVLRVSLQGPLAVQAMALFSVWLTAMFTPVPEMTLAMISAVIPACAIIMIGYVLAILGGRTPSDWAMVILMLVFIVLANACVVPLAFFHLDGSVSTVYLAVPLSGWALLGLVALWIGLRGMFGYLRRPHIFLIENTLQNRQP